MGELPLDEDVDREVAFHIEMRTRELVQAGWSPAAARDEALRLFGSVEEVSGRMKRETRARDRAIRRFNALDAVRQDLRFAFRSFVRSPGFTVVAVLTLALGIGANTAVFSLVNGVILRPLSFPEPDRIVRILERSERFPGMGVTWPNFRDWQEEARGFQSLAAYSAYTVTLLGGDRPVQGRVAPVSREFFDVLGISPMMGRGFLPEEHREGADPGALVSHTFWESELGAEPDLATLTLEAGPFRFRVVGVMPPSEEFPTGTDVWFPLELSVFAPDSRTAHNYVALGRLAPGVALATAREDLSALTARITRGIDSDYAATSVRLDPLQEVLTGDVRTPLILLLGAAALVLLVACSNLASTFLARATNRERELAVRASLGAGRGRLVRQLFTEALALTSLGAASGVLLSLAVVRALPALAPPGAIPRMDQVDLDGTVLLFTTGISVLTAVLFGLLPGFRVTRAEPGRTLRGGERGSSRSVRGPLWRFLVGGEVALAVVVLVGAGLLLRSFREVVSVDPGFDPEGVVTASVSLPTTRFPTASDRRLYYQELLRELEALPGARTVGIVLGLPLGSGAPGGQVDIEGGPTPFVDGTYQVASAGYFRAMGIPLLAGRLFEPSDDSDAEHVVVVSESFAELAWPGEDPIGKRMTGGGMDNYTDPDGGPRWARVVGVVGDVREDDLTLQGEPTYYFHYLQRPQRLFSGNAVVEARGSPADLVPAIRALARRLNSDVPTEIRLMGTVLGRSLGERRFTTLLLGAFGALALALTGVGIYGVVSYSVARRTREMGIRLALGARPAQVRSLVQKHALVTVVLGAGVGVAGALLLARLLESLLFQVQGRDPLTLTGVVILLVGTSWLASWIPARRSTRVDPLITMRAE